MRTLTDIRSSFIDFFKRQGHEPVSSSSLVPKNDPTLLFTNAGMVQFKDLFTGQEKRFYTRATTAQKCVRAGGKHNDLENVGYTARHHTFFEMLGNFSFGDYFKDDAIEYAWTLIHKEFGLPKDKLLVTVYSEDEEAAAIWKKVAGFSEDRIIRIPTSDNFWSMGDTGPCGPCTEIFYDHGPHIPGGPPGSPDQDGDRFIEIWNLVFMQFEQFADGSRIHLPKPSVDTGMGIERIAAVMQGVHNNYDTDLFKAIIQSSMELTKTSDPASRHSHNVIADHLRSTSFLLADGVLPSNEGRGYVLRRIMRRAMRHAHLLGAQEPLMYRLVPTLVELMGQAYPELGRAQALIVDNLKLEEERFRQTLERGLRLLDEETVKLTSSQAFPGDIAFKLYDTYGFPLDLTQDVLKSQGRTIDMAGFETAMAAQKAAARAAWVGTGDAKNEQVWYDLKQEHGATEFLGYEVTDAEGMVLALVDNEGKALEAAFAGDKVQILSNQTPFYAESGGQEGDRGFLSNATVKVKVVDTVKRLGELHVHIAEVIEGTLKIGDHLKLNVDTERRLQVQANHSATHLLHATLRRLLGDHVTQKGSLVAEDRLRFDFTHTKPLTEEELRTIERDVNHQIIANTVVETHLMDVDAAIAKGAMALFGERYGDEVRVLSMGSEVDQAYSVELCGGTHVSRTGDIGVFKILSEVGISSGVRRIEAVTGMTAWQYLYEANQTLQQATNLLKTAPVEFMEKLTQALNDRRILEKQVADLRQKLALAGDSSSRQSGAAKQVGNYKVIVRQFESMPTKDLKPLADKLKQEIETGVVILTNREDDKVSLVVAVTDNLVSNLSAVDLVRLGAEALGGKGGGGRPDMAQAGGVNPVEIPTAIEKMENYISSH
ncbi:alanine--tRNA ligase [Candidatus Paracaedibacter symbiosus]|uniref:alanine--tRNA ligase n=1 Tax=Candidatus Paracaedibacter symbiosus TaxID=244582 RepID=UPI000509630E|nr:alanine--tRNA ligase [Candidatus Paracaedibacter symbiosus]